MSFHAIAHPTAGTSAKVDSNAVRLAFRIGFVALAVFFALMTILPLLVLLKVSISAPEDVMTGHPPFWIYNPTLDHWRSILNSDALWSSSRHSFVVATGTAFLAVLIAAPAAYVISRL